MTSPAAEVAEGGIEDMEVDGAPYHNRIKLPSLQTTVEMFREFRDVLDEKNDRLERIVKLSRDVTIESKRIIFQLHRASTDSNALDRAAEKLHITRERMLHRLALELEGVDKYYFVRAFTPGLQEYIEAFGFYKFLRTGTLLTYEEFQNDVLNFLVYTDSGYQCSRDKHSRSFAQVNPARNRSKFSASDKNTKKGSDAANTQKIVSMSNNKESHESHESSTMNVQTETDSVIEDKEFMQNIVRSEAPATQIPKEKDTSTQSQSVKEINSTEEQNEVIPKVPKQQQPNDEVKTISVYLPQQDFLLGLTDIPGELMRACVLAVSQGDRAFAFKACELVQHLYKECCRVFHYRREMPTKIRTMKASVEKMEYSCYSMVIRGSDKVKSTMLDDIFDDGGSYMNGEDYDSGTE